MIRSIRFAGLLLAGVFVLAPDYVRLAPIEFDGLRQWRDELVSLFNSRDIQLVEVGCLAAYILGFAVWRHWQLRRTTKYTNHTKGAKETVRTACLLIFCGLAIGHFFAGPSNPSASTAAPVLLFGVVIGQALQFIRLTRRNAKEAFELSEDILTAFLILLTIAVFVQPGSWQGFEYHGQRRWQGIWWNPNTYGVLMALGVVLGAGRILSSKAEKLKTEMLKAEGEHRTSHWGVWVRRVLLLGAAGVMAVGLVESYSRAAWLGAALGLGYLGYQSIKWPGYRESALARFLRWNWLPLGVLAASLVVLGFCTYRDTGNLPVRRVFSVANVNDFSWRNRVVAYEGALQMMGARPWLGFGWDQPKRVYEALYMPANLDDGRAIELNDYFTLGTTLGVPALLCFVLYVALGLARAVATDHGPPTSDFGVRTSDFQGAVCRAGLMVLLVGFWLQQGLFWVSLTVPFWVLLELASPVTAHSGRPAAGGEQWVIGNWWSNAETLKS
jgi:O-antigen ligase